MNAGWHKATFSGDNAYCVKVRFDGPDVLVGDTKNAGLGDREPILRLPATRWAGALATLPTLTR
jgi:hypothetical protein